MPVNTPIRVGTVGLLDTVHVLTDWSAAVTPSFATVEVSQQVSYLATVVLAVATWFVLRPIFKALSAIFETLVKFHTATNHVILVGILMGLRTVTRGLLALEAHLNKVANET
jgi:hypothetical protein